MGLPQSHEYPVEIKIQRRKHQPPETAAAAEELNEIRTELTRFKHELLKECPERGPAQDRRDALKCPTDKGHADLAAAFAQLNLERLAEG
jgi:hypothetical protein